MNRYFRLDYRMGNFPYTSFHKTEEDAQNYRRLCTSATWWEITEIKVDERDVPFLELCSSQGKEKVEKTRNGIGYRLGQLFSRRGYGHANNS